MSGLLEQLVNHLVERLDPNVIGPGKSPVVGPGRPTTIEAPYRQAWDEKRWRQTQSGGSTEIVGPYRVFDRRRRTWREFAGRLVQDGRAVSAYIADPPARTEATSPRNENVDDSVSGELVENIMASIAQFYSGTLSAKSEPPMSWTFRIVPARRCLSLPNAAVFEAITRPSALAHGAILLGDILE